MALQISPSILSADFARLAQELDRIADAHEVQVALASEGRRVDGVNG